MGTWARNNTWKYIKIGKEADDLPAAPPSGKKTIDSTAEVDVSSYATAQVVDANLTAGNIKKDVSVLGITGSYEGGGSSDFSTAEVTIVNNTEESLDYLMPFVISDGDYNDIEPWMTSNDGETFTVALYKGTALGYITQINIENPVELNLAFTGDIADEGGGGAFDITGDGTITITAST